MSEQQEPKVISQDDGQSRSTGVLGGVIERCQALMDYEAKAAAHHAKGWHAAHKYHLTRFAAMSDLMAVMRSN